MNKIIKATAVAALTGALAVGAATPSQARHGRNAALIGGLAAGAFIGAAAANANDGYYYGPNYDYYAPGYAYAPDYGYAYEPAPVYGASRYYHYGRGNTQKCGQSPASPDYVPCTQ